MKKLLWNYCKLLGSLGLIVGFALGFLYGIGGFFHDLLLAEINRGTYLALNALLGYAAYFRMHWPWLGSTNCTTARCYAKNQALRKLSTAKR